MVQKDVEQESEMRAEIQQMKKEQASISMMDEFARYARLERKINKMTDKLKTHGEGRGPFPADSPAVYNGNSLYQQNAISAKLSRPLQAKSCYQSHPQLMSSLISPQAALVVPVRTPLWEPLVWPTLDC